MPAYDGPDLVSKCQFYSRRPAVDPKMTPAQWYTLLTEAQPRVFEDLFSRVPEMRYSAPATMTTADGGKTFSFGVDAAGDPIYPYGSYEIYPTLASVPDYPLVPGVDFMVEGSLIRIPANRTRTFSSGPVWRGVADPDVAIDATHAPVLFPKSTRMLLVYDAVKRFGMLPANGINQQAWETQYQDELTRQLIRLRTAANLQSSEASGGIGAAWWRVADLGGSGLNS